MKELIRDLDLNYLGCAFILIGFSLVLISVALLMITLFLVMGG